MERSSKGNVRSGTAELKPASLATGGMRFVRDHDILSRNYKRQALRPAVLGKVGYDRSQLLRQGIQPGAKAGLIAGCRVPVDDALLDCLIEGGDGLAETLLCGLLIALGECLAQVAERCAQARAVGPIMGCTPFSLPSAFQRRKMICHLKSLPSFLYRDIRVGPNKLFYRCTSLAVKRIWLTFWSA